MISKKARHESKHVNNASQNIIQFILEGIITKQLKQEDITNGPVKETPNPDEWEFKCDICERKFSSKQGCSIHNRKVHAKNQIIVENKAAGTQQEGLVCSTCGDFKETEDELSAHIEYKHEKGTYNCATCGEIRETALTLNAHIEFRHGKGLKRSLSVMRSKPKDNIKRFTCTKCSTKFQFENELSDHIIKHTNSPPNKRNKVDFLETNSTNKEEEDMESEVTELLPEDDVEEMPEIKKAEVKTVEERKPAKLDSELNDCFDVISNIHECQEDQFKLRYEHMRLLKELTKIMEEVKLENKTLNFIARTVDDPKLLEEVFNENTRLIKENKELVSTLELRNQKISDLELQPAINHTWRQEPESNVMKPSETNRNDKHKLQEEKDSDFNVNDLQRLADLKLSGHRRDTPQAQANIQPQISKDSTPRRFICNKCDKDNNTSEELEEHLDSHFEDGDYTCDTCLFQCNKLKLLKLHLLNSPGHSSGQVRGRSAQKCNICEEKFISRKDLMTHVTLVHPSYKTCRDFKDNKCRRSKCRYAHNIIKEGNCVCFQCGKEFSDKGDMMMHIKKEHKSKTCTKFLNNQCDRVDGTEDECWFNHVKDVNKSTNGNVPTKTTLKSSTPIAFQGFRPSPLSLVPPIPPPALDVTSLVKSFEESIQKTCSLMMQQLLKEIKA